MVDKIITRQELVDAQKDAQTLEDVINGAPNVLIETRLGRKVYTIASVPQINTMSRDEIEADLAQKADLALLPLKADKADTFTKTEVTGLIAPKVDKTYVDTALSGFTNGASKWYATLALAEADITNITIKDKVDIGEIANGGTWYKAIAGATSLTKSPFDAVEQAKADATTKANVAEANAITAATATANLIAKAEVSKIAINNNAKLLHVFADVSDNVYAHFNENAELQLTGLDLSVQAEIQAAKDKSSNLSSDLKTDLFAYVDKNGDLITKIDENGQLFLVGLSKSVQEYLLNIGDDGTSYSSPKTYKTKASLLTNDAAAMLPQASPAAPVGVGMLPQQYHLGKNWINNLTMPVSANRIVIGAYNDLGTATTWNADSGVVHPNVTKFDEPVCGYKYWMGINPYTSTNENFELPYIYGSNSDALDTWTLIPNFAQPFDVDPPNTDGVMSGHLSDSCFTYDPINGELWFFWRQTLYFDADRTRTLAKQTFFGRKTKDGTTWSDKLVVYPQYTVGSDLRLSPSIVFNPKDGLFYLYYINLNGSMSCETTASINQPNWVKVADIVLPFVGWHLDMKWCGDALVALIHSDTVDQLYLGISRDMKKFDWNSGLFNAATNLYKSTFLPVFNDNDEISLRVVYTTDQNSSPKWQLHTTQTNFTSIED